MDKHTQAIAAAIKEFNRDPFARTNEDMMQAAIAKYLEEMDLVPVPRVATLVMQSAALPYVTRQKQAREVYQSMIASFQSPLKGVF